VYFDYTGNLGRVSAWMSAIVENRPVSHLALTGEAGTGKTAALINAATEHNIKVIDVDFGMIGNGYLPSIVRQVRNLRQHSFVIYLDNVDIPDQNEAPAGEMYYFINNLERQVEGATSLGRGVKFAMSTSTYDRLPTALKQRFSLRFDFQNPDMEAQEEIVAAHLGHMQVDATPDDILKDAYDGQDLSSLTKDKWLTPRQLRDAVITYTFEKV